MTARELDVLNIVFDAKKPITSTEITERNPEITQSTVIAVLRKLQHENIIEIVGQINTGKIMTRQYAPSAKAKNEVEKHFLNEFKRVQGILSAEEISKIALSI